MAQYTRHEVISVLQQNGMVPLFYHEDADTAKEIIKACYDGGARLLEFTHRGDFAQEVFRELIAYTRTNLPGMILGVGSVTDAASASYYMMIGANFIVTPVFREDIAIVCNRRKVLWSPGCGSLTEIARAEELGAEIVKLFPGNLYGPSFVKAIKGPQPWTSIMPTGGVTTEADNLKAWFDAGVTCVGMGSQLISTTVIKNKAYAELTETVKSTLALIQSLKKST
ncbi:MAG: bifunctional 4-hydroxy-2-oxoglutarate aldolase/2-dehydro-3-deoxy-phosphogluconate aldolase [Bacteroidetes bacterium]|nr:bifunctional 4-hydroxy-2-oxoglutarate aldolase/2-dehydro-3-deoxy-phosphogluconate aldolase [Bacteroidota bacterium]MDA0984846.1 bifunctional 4-hydroxy-2-oxoglutarate aldolase/2-dehydro-3-deoxy-phosphogluconate aldolase [Bacteroidota bacterium]